MGGEPGASEAISIVRVAEAEISQNLSGQLQSLLQACFPGYPGRSYFKLPPHFRYLAMAPGGAISGQAGVEFRVIRAGSNILQTFGIVNLCVHQHERSRGLASRLLEEVTGYARACGVSFILLFADDSRLYARHGWVRAANRCSWVKIDNHTTIGLARRLDPGALMVKPLTGRRWPDGDVDLLGHLF